MGTCCSSANRMARQNMEKANLARDWVSYWVCFGMSALLYCPSASMVPSAGYPSVSAQPRMVSSSACHASWFSFSSSCRSPPTVFGGISHSSLPLPTQRRLPSRMLMGMSRGSPPYPISTPHHLAPTRERLLALPDRHSPHQEKDQTPSASAVSVLSLIHI